MTSRANEIAKEIVGEDYLDHLILVILVERIAKALESYAKEKVEEERESIASMVDFFSDEDDAIFRQLDDKGAMALRVRAKISIAKSIRSRSKEQET